MSKEVNVLGGFEAVFEEFQPGFAGNKFEDDEDTTLDLDSIKGDDDDTDEPDTPFDDEDDVEEVKPKSKQKKETIEEPVEIEEDDEEEEDLPIITEIFSAFSEEYGWELEEGEEKPKTIEEFMEYVQNQIDDKSVPTYSSKEVQELDDFIRNGGKLQDYLNIVVEANYDDIDIDDVMNQRKVVGDLLKRQGLNERQIARKLDKYDDAGILEDEAEEALELLKEYKAEDKERLLKQQEEERVAIEESQRKFYDTVIGEVKALKDIRGISIPEKEKRELLEYMFKPTKTGRTQYQEDYAKHPVNLVESAYFTKNRDKLIDSAKKAGEKSAVDRLKNKLRTGSQSKSKRQSVGGSSKSFVDFL